MAAKRATDVYAYGEAVRLLEQALKVQEVLDPEDKAKRCDLLLDLCDALLSVPDTKRILNAEAPAAFALAESLGDSSRGIRACMAAIMSIAMERLNFGGPEAGQWVERADRYARPDTVERVFADTSLGARKYWSNDRRSGLSVLNQAVDLARRIGNQDALWFAGAFSVWHLLAPHRIGQRMRLGEELWAASRAGLNANLMFAFWCIVDNSIIMARRKQAEEVWGELRTIAERTGHIQPGLMSASVEAAFAVMDGRLEDARDMARSVQARGEEAGLSFVANVLAFPGARAQLYLGASLAGHGKLGAALTPGTARGCIAWRRLTWDGRKKRLEF